MFLVHRLVKCVHHNQCFRETCNVEFDISRLQVQLVV